MYKLVVFDMDGTLLNSDHIVSKENLKALEYLKGKGIKVVIATGRPSELLKKYTIEHRKESYPLNIEKLENDIMNYFDLSKKENCNTYIDLPIDNKALFFYDKVTHLSVVRMIIIKIEKLFCNNRSKISHVEIKENNNILIATVYYI